jgi:glycerol-3-phosphate O-acyltransferase / dihydroxyacetone phosphate acyltransferase
MRPLVRVFLRIAFRFYFRRVHVRDRQLVPEGGPVLLVANHPNSLVDPALLIHILDRPVHFGARHGLFDTPLAPVLRALGVIRLVRARDEPGAMRQNMAAIDTYVRLLGEGRATAIFPEGVSQDFPHLAPVKNGAARIALQAEASQDFRLGLRILPVGLQFQPRRRFRGEAFVRFGEPFSVRDLGSLYSSRPREAIRDLTARIGEAMQALAFHVEETDRLWLVDRLSDVYFQRIRKTGLVGTGRSGLLGELRYRMAACLNYFLDTDPSVVAEVERALGRYDRLRKAAGIRSRLVEEPAGLLPGVLAPLQATAEIIVGSLPALAGILTSGVPYLLTRRLARRLALGQRHLPSLSILHILIGTVAFPVFWSLFAIPAFRFLTPGRALLVILVLPLLGLFSLAWIRRVRKLAVHVSGRLALWLRLEDLTRVRQAQHELLELMDEVRVRYQREVFGIAEPAP